MDDGIGGRNGFRNTSPELGVKFLSDSMSNSLYYNIGASTNGDPQTSQDWVNYLNSRWKNGQSVTYGGNGYNISTSSKFTKYMLTGEPSTQSGWTELSSLNAPVDRRLLGSIPVFSLVPNERKTIEIAVGYGRTTWTSSVIGKNVPEMKSVMNDIEQFWDTLSIPVLTFATNDSCNLTTSIEELLSSESNLSVFPVPSSGEYTIETE
ncbi:hypothetical protein N9502_01775 [Vicingaceae bacterium]|nr:hypothetical protein [Vicingaceae bacterium]